MSLDALSFTPRIAITMGDPCGVGPEIIVKAFSSPGFFSGRLPFVVGDGLALRRAIEHSGASMKISLLTDLARLEEVSSTHIIPLISPRELSIEDIQYGSPSKRCCEAVIHYIETAVGFVVAGQAHAVCTCPIHKANLHKAGFAFPGHTEFLQNLSGAENVVMMLAGPRLRVSLVTIHHALSEAIRLIDHKRLINTIRITGESLHRDFGLRTPRIAVAGLNPHAGEEGQFGREEIDLIGPVVKSFESSPYKVSGPYAPDTLFFRAYEGEFDAVVAMYHDQGLIPLKLVHFRDAVNISLGLPIIRTSVDHGTAYEIAGAGMAHEGSLLAAVDLAALMSRNRASFSLME